jgi:hypothetical protein
MDDKRSIPELVQALSDCVMDWRFANLEVKYRALLASNALTTLQDKLLASDEYKDKVEGMDAGDVEEAFMQSAAGFGAARKVHTWLRSIGKRIGLPTPKNPKYTDEYLELAKKKIEVAMATTMQRR